MNVTVLIGRLTRNPELKHTPNGIAVAYLNIAVNRIIRILKVNMKRILLIVLLFVIKQNM